MRSKEAIGVLECMAIDMTEAMAGLSDRNPMTDVLRQRLDAINVAQDALRTQMKTKVVEIDQFENKPLTLDELREMDGEPVWCVSMLTGKSEWAILRIVQIPKTWLITVSGASAGYGDKDTYGQTWLAYRYKPTNV